MGAVPAVRAMLLHTDQMRPSSLSTSPIRLPKPNLPSSVSLGRALRLRKTVRTIGSRKLKVSLLSNLLFAACGVNRKQGPFRASGITAASASNSQEVDVYVALGDGAYRFDSGRHALVPVVREDIRALAYGPHQPLISPEAPVQLIFVVDMDKLEHTSGFDEPGLHDPEVQKSYYYVDTGLIAANVYLFAAAAGLACWFHNCDRGSLAERLQLRESQRVLFAQTVGYPATARRSTSRSLDSTARPGLSSEARNLILVQHAQLRAHMAEVSELARLSMTNEQALEPLRAKARGLYAALDDHMHLEESVLEVALRDVIGRGSELHAQLGRDHERQRALLTSAMADIGRTGLPAEELVRSVRRFVEVLLRDMGAEEQVLLTAEVDALIVDSKGG